MTNHFAYLLEDDTNEFMQKVACEEAERVVAAAYAAPPETIEKVAASPIEKLAQQVDRDLIILKEAGPCGVNMGMQKRASAYMDRALCEWEVSAEEFLDMFDKVAATAIQVDLDAARAQLGASLEEKYLPWLDAQLAKVGQEAVKLAMMEKEALLPVAVRGLLGATRGVVGRGASTAARGVARGAKGLGQAVTAPARAVGRGARAAGRGVAAVPSKIRAARSAAWQRESGKIEKARQAIKGAPKTGVGRAAQSGALGSLEARQAKLKDKLSKQPAVPTSKATASKVQDAAKAKSVESEAGRQRAKGEAAEAATKGTRNAEKAPIDKPTTPEAKTTEYSKDDIDAIRSGSPKDELTLGDTIKAFQEKGWKGLDQRQKQKLFRAGAGGALGYRVLTGHGAVTGGEGLI